MLIIAEQKNTRQTPRKVRLVANTVRKMPLDKALKQLAVMERKATIVVLKVIRQALANAVHNHRVNPEDLTLNNILVTEGARYKRFRAVSRGRAHNVAKKTCHIKVVLETKAGTLKPAKDNKKFTKPVVVKKKTKVETKKEVAKNKEIETSKASVAPVVKKMAPQKVATQKPVAGTTNIRRGTK